MNTESFRQKIKEFGVEFASEDKVNCYPLIIDFILGKIADTVKNPGVRAAYITDLSSISDFCDETLISELSFQFGFEVQLSDLLIDIAEKIMRQK